MSGGMVELLIEFTQCCSSKPPDADSHSHRSPTHAPSTPCTPAHGRVLVHLSGFDLLVRNMICVAHLLISLVLVRSTDVGLVMSRVREDVVGSAFPVDH